MKKIASFIRGFFISLLFKRGMRESKEIDDLNNELEKLRLKNKEANDEIYKYLDQLAEMQDDYKKLQDISHESELEIKKLKTEKKEALDEISEYHTMFSEMDNDLVELQTKNTNAGDEIKALKNENTRLSILYVISNLSEHILFGNFSEDTLRMAFHFEYISHIQKRESLDFPERIKYDQDVSSPKPHLAEMALISVILDDMELYDKLVEYLYQKDIDHQTVQQQSGTPEPTAVASKNKFNNMLHALAFNYLSFNHIDKSCKETRPLRDLEYKLHIFNALVGSYCV